MTKKIKVCHITTVHQAFDGRIFHKECKTLAKASFDVTLIAKGEKEKIVDGVTLIPLHVVTNRLRRMLFPNLEALKLALKQRADIYHFHDPELIPVGILLKLLLRKTKVIYDVHEDYREKILSKTWIREEFRIPIAFLFSILEKFCTLLLDFIVTADSHTKRKFPKRRTESIANFPPLNFVNKRITEIGNRPFKMIYAGRISEDRGIHVIIEALKYLPDDIFELHLLGRIDGDHLLDLFSSCKNIHYHGELPWQDVSEILIKAHVGLAIFQPVPAYLYCPGENIVKLFEYMAAGLPIIISDFPKLKTLITEFGCGFAVDPLDARSIAQKVEYLYHNSDLRKQMGKRGRGLVLEKYNWENESQKLLDIYANVLGR